MKNDELFSLSFFVFYWKMFFVVKFKVDDALILQFL